ncbi:hypothetical protein D3C73_1475760 [compost metagenome]
MDGGGNGDAHIHNSAQTRQQNPGEQQPFQLHAGLVCHDDKHLDLIGIVAGYMQQFTCNISDGAGQKHADGRSHNSR